MSLIMGSRHFFSSIKSVVDGFDPRMSIAPSIFHVIIYKKLFETFLSLLRRQRNRLGHT